MPSPDPCQAARRRHLRVRPGARLDRPSAAIAVVDRAVAVPRRNETIALLLDHARHGVAIVSVAGTDHADDVVEVVELLTTPSAHRGRADALVVASVWCDPPADRDDRPVVDRWLELHQIAADRGVELLDWFEFTDRVTSLRVEAGAPSRW